MAEWVAGGAEVTGGVAGLHLPVANRNGGHVSLVAQNPSLMARLKGCSVGSAHKDLSRAEAGQQRAVGRGKSVGCTTARAMGPPVAVVHVTSDGGGERWGGVRLYKVWRRD